jgi:hypothetical protein
MAAYVPADSLLYIEADSLPVIAGAVTKTDAWAALAPAAGIRAVASESGWAGKVMAWTGIGSAESVVLSRSQLAVVALGLDAASGDDALHVRPRYGFVVETHSSEARALKAVEARIGSFATRTYVNPFVERKTVDGVQWITWTAPSQDRRIIAAVTGSLVLVANDEAVIRACLDAKRGARPSLAGNQALADMRQRMNGSGALAFGYVSPEGVARLLDVYAVLFAAQMTDNPELQELGARLSGEVARKTFGAMGWSARVFEGRVEDRYYLGVNPAAMERLAPALKSRPDFRAPENDLLPPATYSLTHYNLSDPFAAWTGLNGAMSARLDVVLAAMVPIASAKLLETYGIDDPAAFLHGAEGQMITARLENQPGSTVTIVTVNDRASIEQAVQKRLGSGAKKETVGDVEILVSADPRRGAAAFVGEVLLLGQRDRIRQCLEARTRNQTVSSAPGYTRSLKEVDRSAPPISYTLTNDSTSARDFILALANQSFLREREPDPAQLTAALEKLPYVITQTKLVEGGFERRTRSAFGQFGTIATQFTGSR